MKSYKIKSLFFFFGFAVCALVYYNMEQEGDFQEQFIFSEMADLEADDEDASQELEEELSEDDFSN